MSEGDMSKKRKYESEGKHSPEDVKQLLSFWTPEQYIKFVCKLGSENSAVLAAIHAENDLDPKRRKLFVRSLSFETTDESLRAVFEQYGEIIEAVVIMNKTQGKSKGFGFVTFATVAAAEAALQQPAKEIDGRTAYANLAAKKMLENGGGGGGGGIVAPGGAGVNIVSSGIPGDTTLTKLFIRQLDYSTTSETLHEHFKQFGAIKEAVVLTNKETGQSKGYGFITFEDASSATRALSDPSKVIDGRTTFCKLAAAGNPNRPPTTPFQQQQRGMMGGGFNTGGYNPPQNNAGFGGYQMNQMNPYASNYGQYNMAPNMAPQQQQQQNTGFTQSYGQQQQKW